MTDKTEEMLNEIEKYMKDNPDMQVVIVAHSHRYANYLANEVRHRTGKKVKALSPGNEQRLRGWVGKAFVDHYFNYAEIPFLAWRDMNEQLRMLEQRTESWIEYQKKRGNITQEEYDRLTKGRLDGE